MAGRLGLSNAKSCVSVFHLILSPWRRFLHLAARLRKLLIGHQSGAKSQLLVCRPYRHWVRSVSRRLANFWIAGDPVKYRQTQADLPNLAGRPSGRRRRNVAIAVDTLLTDSTKSGDRLGPCPQTDDSPIGQIRGCNQEGD